MRRRPAAAAAEIVVDPPAVTNGALHYMLHAGRPIKEYLPGRSMVARYDVDVGAVPTAIQLVPLVATVAPIAWALDAELRIPVADQAFLDALAAVRRGLERLYPAVAWGGSIRTDDVVDLGETSPGDAVGLLFSRGVDSLASFAMHRDASPRLVSVWGADVGLRQRRAWDRVASGNREFARRRSVPISFIESNFRTFFNHYKLRARFFRSFPNWYSAAQQGVGLTALCAPLSWIHGLRWILIPGTHDSGAGIAWGSHPDIDPNVRWASTRVVYDGVHLGRQAKLDILAEDVRGWDPGLDMRVCWGRASNCCRCTKCHLTMVGLALAGLDPNDHGFRFDSDARAGIRASLERDGAPLSETAVLYWKEIQREAANPARPREPALEEFYAWLSTLPLPERGGRRRGPTLARARQLFETRGEPAGRWMRTLLGNPFP